MLPLQMSSMFTEVCIITISMIYVRPTNDDRVRNNEAYKDKGCEERFDEHVRDET